ncbi:MAG: 3-oxoacyl-ACP reductase FabG [Theionarchaea archaeon]|nr:3-oxoacyl-ACP reductase FabG [Theionarchaea archaeon]
MRLKGKVALITGASRGIGRAIALAFANEGCNIVVNYCSSVDEAKKVVGEIEEKGQHAIAVQADVSRADEVKEMVLQTVTTFGRIDILVNNAAVLLPFSLETPDFDNWQRMVDVNIKGILLCAHAVAAPMRGQGRGRIINIVMQETKGSLDYGMTKAAGGTVTRGLARDLAPLILVNAIAPGYIDTGWISSLPSEEQEAIKERILLRRWGQPKDVAQVAVFLASDQCEWMTGTTILLDGGERLSL